MNLLRSKGKAEQVETLQSGLIAEAEQHLEIIKDQIREYNRRARELREEAKALQQTGSDNALKVRELRIQADHLDQLAQGLDRNERSIDIKRLDRLKEEAEVIKSRVNFNNGVLTTCENELITIENEYKRRLEQAKDKVEFTKHCIEEDEKRLAELEGGSNDR